jgi:hypothetical protein
MHVSDGRLGLQVGSQFGYLESSIEDFDFDIVVRMLRDGHCQGSVAYVIRSAIPSVICRTIYSNFKSIVSQKGSHRALDDIIKADQIGSTQFQKSGQEYAESTARAELTMLSLFDDLSAEETSRFMLDDRLVPGFLERGLYFGPARFKSTNANYCTIRAWLDNGGMSLHPHEDISQVEMARSDNFEIHKVRNAVSFNVCVAYSGTGNAT